MYRVGRCEAVLQLVNRISFSGGGGVESSAKHSVRESVSPVKLDTPENKIRAVVLTSSFPLSKSSVSGVFVRRLVDALPSSVDVEVVTPCATAPADICDGDGYRLRCFRYAPWKWQRLAHLPGGIPVALRSSRSAILLLPFFLGAMFLATLRASRSADIVHANWSISGFIAAMACRLTRTPLVTTIRGEDLSRAETSAVYRLFLRVCMHYGRRVVAVGGAMGQRLREMFPGAAGKVMVLPNGVSPELLSLDAASISGRRSSGLRVLVVGSLIPRKGVDTVINAIAGLPDATVASLTLVGDGSERPRLEALAREQGVDGKVQFVGETDADKVMRYYASTDAFILASYSEGRPNVVMEAMAAAVPVVASEIDGVKELINAGETGLLFEAGNADSLAEQLARISGDIELRATLARRARQFIVDNRLLWSNTGAAYEKMYRDVLLDSR